MIDGILIFAFNSSASMRDSHSAKIAEPLPDICALVCRRIWVSAVATSGYRVAVIGSRSFWILSGGVCPVQFEKTSLVETFHELDSLIDTHQ